MQANDDRELRVITDKALSLLISMSGGDSHYVDRKFKKGLANQRSEMTIVAAYNGITNLSDQGGIAAGRIIFLPTTQSFLGRENRQLKDQLKAELPGILNWAIDGYRKLLEDGRFHQTTEGQRAADEFATSTDPIREFADEYISKESDGGNSKHSSVALIYDAFRMHCLNSGIKDPPRKSNFKASLKLHLGKLESENLVDWHLRDEPGQSGSAKCKCYRDVWMNKPGYALADCYRRKFGDSNLT